MIAHYGYQDGTGEYYISIDTVHCAACPVGNACVSACPQQMFEMIEDDYGQPMAWIKEDSRRWLSDDCTPCKKASADQSGLPCVAACTPGAIEHSW